MALYNFIYSKLGNLSDHNFNLTYFKQSELESYKCSIFAKCLRNKERLLSRYMKGKKEYLLRVKLHGEILELSEQEEVLSHKHSQILKQYQIYKEERKCRDKSSELKKISLYENNLGLEIERVDNLKESEDRTAISFIFKNVHENKPEERCSFDLVVTDNGLYKVVDCHPVIKELNELIFKLNKTNDLHDFIINVRKKFCDNLLKQI